MVLEFPYQEGYPNTRIFLLSFTRRVYKVGRVTLALGFNEFSLENLEIISNLGQLQRLSRMTKHVSKAGKVDPGDRVILPVKFACKPQLTLTCLLGLA